MTGEAALFFEMYWEGDQRCENLDCCKDLQIFEAQWHHLLSKGAHPEFRLDPRIIITLCVDCHILAHSKGNSALNLPKKYEEYLKEIGMWHKFKKSD